MKPILTCLLLASVPLTVLAADGPAPSDPDVAIKLGPRHGHVTPQRQGFTAHRRRHH